MAPSRDRGTVSESDGAQKRPVPPREFLWRPRSRQHVLLDDDPAGVISSSQLSGDRGKVNVAFAQLAKNSMLERVEIIPLLRA